MKNQHIPSLNFRPTFRVLLAAAILAASALPLLAAEGTTFKGGASKLMFTGPTSQKMTPVATLEDVENLKPGDTVVMACPHCKSITVTRVEKAFKGQKDRTVVSEQHLCPGCGTRLETTGQGKAKTTRIVHVCKDCGSKDAYCCSMPGGSPTQGMEKK